MPFVQSGDVTLFVTEVGSPDRPVVLFSNSLGTTHRMWDRVVDELATDFRCIRYDTRGHGSSTCAQRPFEIADLANDVVAILDNLGVLRAHMVGLSLGGMTGQDLATRHPGRVQSLTLMATTAFMPPAQAWLDRAKLVRRDSTRAILDATLSRWFTPAFLAASAGSVRRVAEEFAAIDPDGYAACCEAIARMDLRKSLPRIAAPTLVIAGQQDPATPVEMSEFLRDTIPGARLQVLDPAAHLLAVEQPMATAVLLAQHVADVERHLGGALV